MAAFEAHSLCLKGAMERVAICDETFHRSLGIAMEHAIETGE